MAPSKRSLAPDLCTHNPPVPPQMILKMMNQIPQVYRSQPGQIIKRNKKHYAQCKIDNHNKPLRIGSHQTQRVVL